MEITVQFEKHFMMQPREGYSFNLFFSEVYGQNDSDMNILKSKD